MRSALRDSSHLLRAAALFVALLGVFFVVRAMLVPEGFGDFGHYRAGALDDNRAGPMWFAGRSACADCHADVVEAKQGSKHQAIGCEACHGALAAHASDPSAGKPVRPDARTVCLVCHLQNVAKPPQFPQVDPKEHAQGAPCSDCHEPHHPEPV